MIASTKRWRAYERCENHKKTQTTSCRSKLQTQFLPVIVLCCCILPSAAKTCDNCDNSATDTVAALMNIAWLWAFAVIACIGHLGLHLKFVCPDGEKPKPSTKSQKAKKKNKKKSKARVPSTHACTRRVAIAARRIKQVRHRALFVQIRRQATKWQQSRLYDSNGGHKATLTEFARAKPSTYVMLLVCRPKALHFWIASFEHAPMWFLRVGFSKQTFLPRGQLAHKRQRENAGKNSQMDPPSCLQCYSSGKTDPKLSKGKLAHYSLTNQAYHNSSCQC